jgi:hypothetical protein
MALVSLINQLLFMHLQILRSLQLKHMQDFQLAHYFGILRSGPVAMGGTTGAWVNSRPCKIPHTRMNITWVSLMTVMVRYRVRWMF